MAQMADAAPAENAPLDVLIIGAGIAGVAMAAQLKRQLPGKRFAMLEQRARPGGTWDLFNYPGIRCDSDFYTLAFNFKPWPSDKSYISGPEIQSYVAEAIEETGIGPHISYCQRVIAANWDSAAALWQVTARDEASGREVIHQARMMASCAGYYDYDEGYTPDYPGLASFKGDVLHPQQWPQGYDYSGKRVVVIGSGATAVTIVPVMAQRAAHVTMLQRSPTWMFVAPSRDGLAVALRRLLPESWAYRLVRFKNIFKQRFSFIIARARPDLVGGKLMDQLAEQLPGYPTLERDFRPRYGPWKERVCLVPDADFFAAMRNGKASVETDSITGFEAGGIRLQSGKLLEADVVVSATGLKLALFGKAQLSLDGVPVQASDHVIYRGAMLDGVPNFAFVFGYTNASWTLKADLVAGFVCRLIKAMDAKGSAVVMPAPLDPRLPRLPFSDFTSGYFQRAEAILPRQGEAQPYRINMAYELDIAALKYGKVDDGTLIFSDAAQPLREAAE